MRGLLLFALLVPGVGQSEILAFIGSPRWWTAGSEIACSDLQIERDDRWDVICMDPLRVLRYEVIEVIAGVEAGQELEFLGFYQYYGVSFYTIYSPAFVVLERVNGRLLLRSIGYAQQRDGKWWMCEEWSEDGVCTKERFAEEFVASITPPA